MNARHPYVEISQVLCGWEGEVPGGHISLTSVEVRGTGEGEGGPNHAAPQGWQVTMAARRQP